MRRPSLGSVVCSIFFRLPGGFLIPFLVLMLFWICLFPILKHYIFLERILPPESVTQIPDLTPGAVAQFVAGGIRDLLFATFIIFVFGVGFLAVYNFSVCLNWAFARMGLKPVFHSAARPHIPSAAAPADNPLRGFKKIGIVLAGGGAKGAFQAGAMKAIYRFLAENGALDKVGVISGTSIGSWNALFWLGNLIQSEDGWDERGAHEAWWRNIRLRSLIAPSWYVPCFKNAFFVTAPWQRQFDGIFRQPETMREIAQSPIHFYLTRSHVRSGKLECTTNNLNAVHIPRVHYKKLDSSKSVDKFMDGVKTGVFASMDLPPLFPYIKMDDDFFEDGGVIDNLPITFAAMEGCDLIFVLPLNSDFYAEPDERSVINRFFRVMDVRQGVLERNNLKLLYLYNEIAALRKHVDDIRSVVDVPPDLPVTNTLSIALSRTNQHLRIFAVCPLKMFVQGTIDTQELWKPRQAGVAFDVMYRTTMELLEQKFDPAQERIQVALVSREGDFTWDENF